MNAEQVKIVGKLVTESALDFLASKHNTTAQIVADLVRAGHENVSRQFYQLMETGLREAIGNVCSTERINNPRPLRRAYWRNIMSNFHEEAAMAYGADNPKWKVEYRDGEGTNPVPIEVRAADREQAINKASQRLNASDVWKLRALYFQSATRI